VTDLLHWLISPSRQAGRRRPTGTCKSDLKRQVSAVSAALLLLASAGFGDAGDTYTDGQPHGSSIEIINKYLQATQTHEDTLRGVSMEVDINADVPSLKEHGRLHALRKIAKVGQITYHVLGFQGDNTIKNQVIARYLQAEQQGQGDESLAITPSNYKFKYKGTKQENGHDVYVFQLSPRKKRVGLFKGEIWLDTKTYLPVYEKGRLVKTPSIFFKKVDFDRAFAIQNGLAVPQSMSSTIDVRLIGKVHLNINYSNFAASTDTAAADDPSASVAIPKLMAK
jgi:hypothetical protein